MPQKKIRAGFQSTCQYERYVNANQPPDKRKVRLGQSKKRSVSKN